MIHNLLIAGHTIAALSCFAIGIYLVILPSESVRARFNVHQWTLWAMITFLIAVVAWDWRDLQNLTRAIYTGLVCLGLYMVFRCRQAAQQIDRPTEGWKGRFIDHTGFTLISLFEGFCIVAAIDLGAPGFVIAIIAVGGVLVGRTMVGRAIRRVEPSAA